MVNPAESLKVQKSVNYNHVQSVKGPLTNAPVVVVSQSNGPVHYWVKELNRVFVRLRHVAIHFLDV